MSNKLKVQPFEPDDDFPEYVGSRCTYDDGTVDYCAFRQPDFAAIKPGDTITGVTVGGLPDYQRER